MQPDDPFDRAGVVVRNKGGRTLLALTIDTAVPLTPAQLDALCEGFRLSARAAMFPQADPAPTPPEQQP